MCYAVSVCVYLSICVCDTWRRDKQIYYKPEDRQKVSYKFIASPSIKYELQISLSKCGKNEEEKKLNHA